MANPREWVRQAGPAHKARLDVRFPAMVEPVREILEEMADTPGCRVSMRQIFEYLQAPEGADGCGLIPGETMTDDYQALRNWIQRQFGNLWALRGGKRRG